VISIFLHYLSASFGRQVKLEEFRQRFLLVSRGFCEVSKGGALACSEVEEGGLHGVLGFPEGGGGHFFGEATEGGEGAGPEGEVQVSQCFPFTRVGAAAAAVGTDGGLEEACVVAGEEGKGD